MPYSSLADWLDQGAHPGQLHLPRPGLRAAIGGDTSRSVLRRLTDGVGLATFAALVNAPDGPGSVRPRPTGEEAIRAFTVVLGLARDDAGVLDPSQRATLTGWLPRLLELLDLVVPSERRQRAAAAACDPRQLRDLLRHEIATALAAAGPADADRAVVNTVVDDYLCDLDDLLPHEAAWTRAASSAQLPEHLGDVVDRAVQKRTVVAAESTAWWVVSGRGRDLVRYATSFWCAPGGQHLLVQLPEPLTRLRADVAEVSGELAGRFRQDPRLLFEVCALHDPAGASDLATLDATYQTLRRLGRLAATA